MPEVRQDPLLGYHVLFAPDRATRPFEHAEVTSRQPLKQCPFCRGNESLTTSAIFELPAVDAIEPSDWGVRVIANRYPALTEQPTKTLSVATSPDFPLRSPVPAIGQHEVIVESPTHALSLAELSNPQFRLIALAYRERLLSIRNSGQTVHASVFKNEGAGAGASLEHVHSQLIATPFVAAAVAQELAQGERYFESHSRCYFCDLWRYEKTTRSRLVFETDDFVCWCPFASQFVSEMWLMPKRHRACFEDLDDAELSSFAAALRDSLQRLARAQPNLPFNYVIHSAPFADRDASHFHWHLEIKPRLTGLAGFEVGAGNHINIVLPEVAAETLRACG